MTSGRSERTKYLLRELSSKNYHRQLQGPPISQRALTTTIEEATHESVAATLEESEATQGETNMATELDRLATLVAQITQRQNNERRERDQREEDSQQHDEQYR